MPTDPTPSSSPRRRTLYLRWLWLRLKATTIATDVFGDRTTLVATSVAIVLLGLVVVDLHVSLAQPLELLVDVLIPLSQVVLGAVFSLELLSYDTTPADRDRLRPPSEVVEYYDERGVAPGFISSAAFTETATAAPDGLPERLPVVSEAIPRKPIPLTDVNVDPVNTSYPLPDRFQELFAPVLTEMQDRFVSEGHFNQLKLRPIEANPTGFTVGKTTFFNNFAANLCADWYVFDHRCPRDLLHPLVFDESGRLRDLDDTPMPYIAASSGLVFSEDGQTVLPIRSGNVVIQGEQLGESFGGSWDWDVFQEGDIETQVRQEYESERSHQRTPEFFHLGAMRRIDLMGKTDLYVCGFVTGDPDWTEHSAEHRFSVVVDVLPEGETFDSPRAVFEHADEVVSAVLSTIRDSPFSPSVGLLVWLWLFSNVTGPRDE